MAVVGLAVLIESGKSGVSLHVLDRYTKSKKFQKDHRPEIE